MYFPHLHDQGGDKNRWGLFQILSVSNDREDASRTFPEHLEHTWASKATEAIRSSLLVQTGYQTTARTRNLLAFQKSRTSCLTDAGTSMVSRQENLW